MKNLFNRTKLALAFFVIISLITLNLPQVNKPVQAQTEQPKYEQTVSVEAKALDTRAVILQKYLSQKGSPMQNNAQDFIEAADKYNLDWKLVPSIAGVESTFGVHIPHGSYNAYGWGVYGTHVIYFDSWKDGIYTLNQGLREKYVNKGLTTPYAINRVYAASPTWGSKVSFLIADLDQFAKKHDQTVKTGALQNVLSLNQIQPKPSSAPIPSLVAFK